MSITRFPGLLSSAGVPILPAIGLLTTTGKVFFVGSAEAFAADVATQGEDPEQPFATLAFAVSQCRNDKGDVIVVMPGHSETLNAAGKAVINKRGVRIVGVGEGDNKPLFTMSHVDAHFDVDAKNVLIHGLRFVSNVNDLKMFIDANEDRLTVQHCEFITSNTKEAFVFIDLATTKDYFVIADCYFEQPTDPEGTDQGANTGAIFCVDSEFIEVVRCRFEGNFETAIFHNKTTACKHLWIRDCYGTQLLNTGLVWELVATATGGIVNSQFISPSATDDALAKFGTGGTATFFMFNALFGNDGAVGTQAKLIGTPAT